MEEDKRFICPNCDTDFIRNNRCPECGQLILLVLFSYVRHHPIIINKQNDIYIYARGVLGLQANVGTTITYVCLFRLWSLSLKILYARDTI